MGCLSSSAAEPSNPDNADTTKETQLSKKTQKVTWKKEAKLKLRTGASFGAPFINETHISFLTSTESPGVVSYDLKAKQWSDNQTVTYEAGALDIDACTYAFNPDTQSLHFIRDNTELMTLDLSTSQLASVGTVSASTDNHVTIQYHKGKVYVLGNEEEKKNEDGFVYVAYDDAMKGIGLQSVTTTVTRQGKDYIYIMGGMKAYARGKESAPSKAPHDELWILDVETKTWSRQHMAGCVASCGVINYENKYLLAFGGMIVEKDEEMIEGNGICGLEWSTGKWFRLKQKLPYKRMYFAVRTDGSDVVRLFSYGGKHLTASLDDIVKLMESTTERFKVSTWNEMGKTVLPTKAPSITNMGPKMDPDSSGDEDEAEDDK
eukprot:49112_1